MNGTMIAAKMQNWPINLGFVYPSFSQLRWMLPLVSTQNVLPVGAPFPNSVPAKDLMGSLAQELFLR